MQRPQSIENEQLQGQKQHFVEAQSLVSPDKPKNKDVHINWQIYSPLKRELSCVKVYPFRNNCGLIPYWQLTLTKGILNSLLFASPQFASRNRPAAYINFNQNTHQIQVLTKPLCRAQAMFYSLRNNEWGTKYRGLTYSAN